MTTLRAFIQRWIGDGLARFNSDYQIFTAVKTLIRNVAVKRALKRMFLYSLVFLNCNLFFCSLTTKLRVI